MSVLDRVKAFLPRIEAANNELVERINREGAQSVRIDGDICDPALPSDDAKKTKKKALIEEINTDIPQDTNDSNNNDDEEVISDNEDVTADGKKIINLEFALGNFDNTIIAQMEDEKEKEEEK